MTHNKCFLLLFTTFLALTHSTNFAASKAPKQIAVAVSSITTVDDKHSNKKFPSHLEKLSDIPPYFTALTNLVAQQSIQRPFIDLNHPDPMFVTWLMRDEVSSKLLPWKSEVDGKICELLAATFDHSQWFIRYTTIHVGLTAIKHLELSLYNNGQLPPSETLLSAYATAIGRLKTGWKQTALKDINVYNEGEIAAPHGNSNAWLLWLKKSISGSNEHILIEYLSKKLGLANKVICGHVYSTKSPLKRMIYLWIAANAIDEFNKKFEMNLSQQQHKVPDQLRSSL